MNLLRVKVLELVAPKQKIACNFGPGSKRMGCPIEIEDKEVPEC